MDYVNSDQLIFVLASPAGGGYRLARIIYYIKWKLEIGYG
jgi:hypothetical protein